MAAAGLLGRRAAELAAAAPAAVVSVAQQQQLFALQQSVIAASAPAWQLLGAFLLGGAVSTIVLTAEALRKAFGPKNVQRARKLFMLVFKRTWQVFVTMLGAASLALVRRQLPGAPCLVIDDAELCEIPRPRLEEAWLILRAGWNEAKRVAAEGVEAIRLELKFTSAVVGQLGMVTLQYMVDRLTPLRFSALMEEALRESLHSMLDDPLINMRLQKLELRRFSAGAVTPKLLAARAYDLGDNAMAFDIDMVWESQMAAEIDAITVGAIGARVPVAVRNLRFAGPVRVVITHLMPEAPGYGAVLLSLASPPELDLDCTVAGVAYVTRVPWLRSELERSMQEAIAEEMLWPRRLVIPADKEGTIDDPVLSQRQLDELTRDDPLLRVLEKVEETAADAGLPSAVDADRDEAAGRLPSLNVNLGVLGLDNSALANFTKDLASGQLTPNLDDFDWASALESLQPNQGDKEKQRLDKEEKRRKKEERRRADADATKEGGNASADAPWWAPLAGATAAVGGGLQVAWSATANTTVAAGSAIGGVFAGIQLPGQGGGASNASAAANATATAAATAAATASGAVEAAQAEGDAANASAARPWWRFGLGRADGAAADDDAIAAEDVAVAAAAAAANNATEIGAPPPVVLGGDAYATVGAVKSAKASAAIFAARGFFSAPTANATALATPAAAAAAAARRRWRVRLGRRAVGIGPVRYTPVTRFKRRPRRAVGEGAAAANATDGSKLLSRWRRSLGWVGNASGLDSALTYVGGVGQAAESTIYELGQATGSTIDELGQAAGSTFDGFIDAGGATMEELGQAIEQNTAAANEAVEGAVVETTARYETVQTWVQALSRNRSELATTLIDEMIAGVEEAAAKSAGTTADLLEAEEIETIQVADVAEGQVTPTAPEAKPKAPAGGPANDDAFWM